MRLAWFTSPLAFDRYVKPSSHQSAGFGAVDVVLVSTEVRDLSGIALILRGHGYLLIRAIGVFQDADPNFWTLEESKEHRRCFRCRVDAIGAIINICSSNAIRRWREDIGCYACRACLRS